ncbi:hypothetical protein [Brevibacillus sp. FIR094]|uniref:hypothetical protein n=1 Tax=Brevibacillus sp. FIR094 TaxID=3134809 RepID=UPI003D1AB3B8
MLLLRSNFKMTSSQLSFGTGRGVVLIGKSSAAVELARASVLSDAVAAVGEATNLAKMLNGAMKQRPRVLYYVGVGTNDPVVSGAYKNALMKGAEAPGVYFFVIDDTSDATIAEVKEFLAWCDTNAIRAVVSVGGTATLVSKASHYRNWIFDDAFSDFAGNVVAPFETAAAAVAAISNENDLSMPFGGIRINGYALKTVKHIDTLRTQTEAGVMSFIQSGTQIEIFQGTTSYVNAPDNEAGLKDPEVVCTVDEVITNVERTIYNKHNRTKISRLPDIKDSVYSVLADMAEQEKIYAPDPDRIIAEPDTTIRGKGLIKYHFNVIPGLKELEIGVTGEVTAQNV